MSHGTPQMYTIMSIKKISKYMKVIFQGTKAMDFAPLFS